MKKILVWGLLAVLGIACYDDLGNYDYNDINDMVLEMPRSVTMLNVNMDGEPTADRRKIRFWLK